MSLVVMIALGLIPWVIAVERLIRGRNRDLDPTGLGRHEPDSPDSEDADTARGNVLADDTLFGAIITETPNPAPHKTGPTSTATAPPSNMVGASPEGGAGTDAALTEEDALMATSSSSLARSVDHQWPHISPDLAIIDSFVPGDDMLELTLDEAEVAAAERAGVRLDIRVERSSTGRGSLITVGGTPLAFVRGSTQVSPRDVVLRIDRLDDPVTH